MPPRPSQPKTPRASAKKAAPAKRTQSGTARRSAREAGTTGPQTSADVTTFLRDLEHPLKQELQAVRELILGVSPAVREGIKWNAPSFHTTDHFATFKLRPESSVNLVLHTGAKVKESAERGVKVDDPAGLLKWLARDRCLVTFTDAQDIQARGPALQAVLREWLQQL